MVWDINTKFSPVVVLMSFQLSTKFEGHNSLKKTAMPLGSSKWKWAWRAHFLSHTLQIWWESLSTLVLIILKFLLWYLKWFPIWQKSVWVFRPYLEESLPYPICQMILEINCLFLLKQVGWIEFQFAIACKFRQRKSYYFLLLFFWLQELYILVNRFEGQKAKISVI